MLAEKAERRLGVGGVIDGAKWCGEWLLLLCAKSKEAGEALTDGEKARGEFENDDPRCPFKPPNSWDDEKGIDEDENFDDDIGAVLSPGRGALTGGGEASRDFSSQKKLQVSIGISICGCDLQILARAQLQHEKQPLLCLQCLVKGNDILVDR